MRLRWLAILTSLLVSNLTISTSAQSNDVIINEVMTVTTSTAQKEFVELLVTKPTGVDMRNWTLTDLAGPTGANSTTNQAEGILQFKSRPFLSNLFYGCRIVVVSAYTRTNPNLLAEDTVAVAGSDSTIILLHPEIGGTALDTVLNNGGTASLLAVFNIDNLVLLDGPFASGNVVDYVASSTNASLTNWTSRGAVWSNNYLNGIDVLCYFRNDAGGGLNNDDGNVGWFPQQSHSIATPGALNPGQVLQAQAQEPGNAVSFNGSGAYVNVPHSTTLNPASGQGWTIAAWVKPDQLTGYMQVAFKGNQLGIGVGRESWSFEIRGDVSPALIEFIVTTPTVGDHMRSVSGLKAGIWQHIAVSISSIGGSSSAYRFYINGDDAGTSSVTDLSPGNITSTFPMLIGSVPGGAWFDGEMDEVSVWNRALSQSEIRQSMIKPLQGDETGLLGVWHFDESNPDSATYDASGNGLNGTLRGGAAFVPSGAMAPVAPSYVHAIAGNQSIETVWNKNLAADFMRYEILYSTNADFSGATVVPITDVNDTTYFITGLVNGTLYYVGVVAIDSVGNVSDTTKDAAVPVLEQGNTLSLDGVDDQVVIGDHPGLRFGTGDFTIEAWIKPTAFDGVGGWNAIITKHNADDGSWVFRVANNAESGNVPRLNLETDFPVTRHFGNSVLETDRWYHVAITRQGTVGTFYLNGQPDGTFSISKDLNTIQPVIVSGQGNVGNERFTGFIDEIRLWSVARSGLELASTSGRPAHGDEPGLVGLWHFDEPSGTEAYDGSQGALNGLLVNGPTFVSSGAMAPTFPTGFQAIAANEAVELKWRRSNEVDFFRYKIIWDDDSDFASPLGSIFTTDGDPADTTETVSGLTPSQLYYFGITAFDTTGNESDASIKGAVPVAGFGRAIMLDGTDDFVQITSPTGLPTGSAARTVEAWIYRENSSNEQGIVQYGSASSSNMFGLVFSGNAPGKLYFYGHNADLASTNSVPVDQWTHVAVTYDGTTLRLYMNGQLENSAAITLNTAIDANGLTIGNRPSLNVFDGLIDEVRIWNVVRDEASILQGMGMPLRGDEPGLAGLWHMDESSGGIAYSSTPGNDGTWQNGATTTASTVPPPVSYMIHAIASDGQVELVWTKNTSPDVVAYRVFGGPAEGTIVQLDSTTSVDDTTIVVSGLTNDTTYAFAIKAVSGEGAASEFSNANRAMPTVEQGRALLFDGSDDYVDLDDEGLLETAEGTIEAWIKPSVISGDHVILSKSYNGATICAWLILRSAGQVEFQLYNGTFHTAPSSTGTIGENKWYHVAATWGPDGMKMYVDGLLRGQNVYTGSPVNTSYSTVIGEWKEQVAGSFGFNGHIDDVRIWSVQRSIDEIRASLGLPLRGDEAGLVSYYRMDEAVESTTLHDDRHEVYNGQVINGALFVPSESMSPRALFGVQAISMNGQVEVRWDKSYDPDVNYYQVAYAIGEGALDYAETTFGDPGDTVKTIGGLLNDSLYVFGVVAVDLTGKDGDPASDYAVPVVEQGRAISLDGVDDKADFEAPYDLTLAEATVTWWVNVPPTGLNDWSDWWSLRTASGEYVCEIKGGASIGNPALFSILDGIAGASAVGTVDGYDLRDSNWHYLTATMSKTNNEVKLFIDGKQVGATGTWSADDEVTDFVVGTRFTDVPGDRHIHSLVDEVGLWNVALDESQIRQTMDRPLRGDEAGLVALWHFDEPSGTTVLDATIEALDGTLDGGVTVASGAMAPLQPAGLTATPASGSVTLHWTPNSESDFLRYRIYLDTIAGPVTQIDSTAAGMAADTTLTINGLVNSQTYYFRIVAVDAVGNSSRYSGEVSFQPTNNPPFVASPYIDWVISEDFGVAHIGMLSSVFEDPDDDPLFYNVITEGSTVDGFLSGDSLFISSIDDAFGQTTLILVATDGEFFVRDTLVVTVNPVNDTPVLVKQIPDSVLNEDFGRVFYTYLPEHFSDVEDTLSFSVFHGDENIQAQISGDSLYVNSIANIYGSANLQITASDGNGGSLQQAFTLTILNVNDPPVLIKVFRDTSFASNFGTRFVTTMRDHFEDGDNETINVGPLSPFPSGIVLSESNDSLYVSSVANFHGVADIVMAAEDGEFSTRDTFRITVTELIVPLNLQTSVLQNPVLSKYADIYVTADTTLQSPPVLRVSIGSDSTVGAMTQVASSRTYRRSVEFTQSGSYTIVSRATSFQGVFKSTTRSFTASLAKPGVAFAIHSTDSRARLLLDKSAVEKETWFLAEAEWEGEADVYRFGPDIKLQTAAEIHLNYEPGTWYDPSKLFIYHFDGSVWNRLESRVYPDDRRVRAKSHVLGRFKVGYDPTYAGDNIVPEAFSLKQNYPNPFNPSTTIAFDLAEDADINLVIYNVLGQQVKVVKSGPQLAGSYSVIWNGRNDRGETVSTGIYFYRLSTPAFVRTRKMILLK